MKFKKRIMLIDPFLEDINKVQQALVHLFDLKCLDSIDTAKSEIKAWQPDLILLEVEQKNQTGYEFCAELQKNIITRFIPIIFISNKQTIDDRLNAYMSGGDDFLQKPFDHQEIIAKINANLKSKIERDILEQKISQIKSELDDKSQVINEQWLLVSFLQEMTNQENPQDIISLLVSTFEKFHLNVCVQITSQGKHIRGKNNNEPFAPLENALFDQLQNKGKYHYFKNRLFIYYPEISVLIKNMPISHNSIYSRYNNYILTVVKVAHQCHSKYLTTNNTPSNKEKAHKSQQKEPSENLDVISFYSKLNHLDIQFRLHQVKSVEVIEELMSNIENDSKGLMLDEEQENIIIGIIKEGMKKSLSLYDNGIKLDLQFGEMLDQLDRALK